MIDTFDNTSISVFKLCPQKYYYNMVLHLVPIVSNNYAAEYGIAFHKAMDVWYTTHSQDNTIKAFVDYWTPFEGSDPTYLRCFVKGIELIKQYISKYTIEPFTVEATEIAFTVELSNKYLYHGKCDGLVLYQDGYFYILEHKTSASKGYLSLKPNHQIDGYQFGVGELYHKDIKGCIFNQIYISKKQNEFVRELTLRSTDDIHNFKRDTISWCDDINRCNDSDWWRKNTNSCGAYYKACEYKILCDCPPESILNVMNTCFKHRKWGEI